MAKKIFFLCAGSLWLLVSWSQPDRWQQRVKYTMDINMNVQTNRFTGKQKLEYWNNSPDTLTKVFYHLYFNAFQPGSMMDTRSRRQGTIQLGRGLDWDPRVMDRILNLKPDEIGYQKIISLKMNGRPQTFNMLETILEVKLDKPILPGSKVVFDMEFEAQVPLQVRRTGRDNPMTRVRYTMSQWYPKLCEYDYEGWHPTPYVAYEFYGVWGDYEVNITIDSKYILGGTGVLQNANQIGYGYETPGTKVIRPTGDKLTWRFIATNVHDFVWAADPDYKHLVGNIPGGPTIHILYKYIPGDTINDAGWNRIIDFAVKTYPFLKQKFGGYPYKQYSFINGGDGGMEYEMACMVNNNSLGNSAHEFMHVWYQGLLGTNESLYPWMDEGFADYAESYALDYYIKQLTPADPVRQRFENELAGKPYPNAGNYKQYFLLTRSGKEEPLTTHADHYNMNAAYQVSSYNKGAVFLEQLGYIVGTDTRDKILLEYYRQWRFKHPNAADFIRVAEKVSDMKLDWYKEYWINSTKTIDYSIDSLWEEGGKTKIRLYRAGLMPMPVDLSLTFKDGTKELHYVPLDLMYGEKPPEDSTISRKVYPAWKWTNSTYVVETNRKLTDFTVVEIDPSQRMADVDRKNNKLELKW